MVQAPNVSINKYKFQLSFGMQPYLLHPIINHYVDNSITVSSKAHDGDSFLFLLWNGCGLV